jgi:hypothetical protein
MQRVVVGYVLDASRGVQVDLRSTKSSREGIGKTAIDDAGGEEMQRSIWHHSSLVEARYHHNFSVTVAKIDRASR